MRPTLFRPFVLLALAHLIKPSYTLLDSGASANVGEASADSVPTRKDDRVLSKDFPAGSLLVTDSEHSSNRPGCRRSTNFFEQVCSIPSGGSKDTDSRISSKLLAPLVAADLLVCDLPEVEPLMQTESNLQASQKLPKAAYAISGTVVVQESDAKERLDAKNLAELTDSSCFTCENAVSENAITDPSGGQPDTSYPGPDDVGFWRQRDGLHEWHPALESVTKEIRTTRDTDSNVFQSSNQAGSRVPHHQDTSRLSEYDAWSAEQEQGAFLSFNEWKERHANDPSAQLRRAKTHNARADASDHTAQVRSPSTDPSVPIQQSEIDYQAAHMVADRDGHQGSTAQTTRRQRDDYTSTSPSATKTSAPLQTGATETMATDAPPRRSILDEAQESSAHKVGFSVAAHATSSQLLKLKHRWNFASLDCAAVVHRTNPEAKFASSILSEKKDRYMLSPCPQPGGKLKGGSQFVIVELCEKIKIDTIVLANYEFFSNMFKKFTVTAASQLTGMENDWTQLGVFRARNVRGQQVFRIPSAPRSEDFFRYVRIDFLEHFGSEFYCPVSLLRVYGITEIEAIKMEFERHSAELNLAPEVGEPEEDTVGDVQRPPLTSADAPNAEVPVARDLHPSIDSAGFTSQDEDIWRKHEQAFQRKHQNRTVIREAAELDIGVTFVAQIDNASSQNSSAPVQSGQAGTPATTHTVPGDDLGSNLADAAHCALENDPNFLARTNNICIRPRGQTKPFYHVSRFRTDARYTTSALDSGSAAKLDRPSVNSPTKSRPVPAATNGAESDLDRGRRATLQRPSGSLPSQQASQGSESVYRAIHRRLNALESNATLSHSYIEHSGQMLREVFARMERRQETRLSNMLRALNASNWQQIESLKRRQHVDLQRAIFEFDVHRQQADNERRALLREVQILAEEVLLEKRLSIAQLVMLLVVFIFVGMTRGSRPVPLLHAGFNKIGRGSKRSEAHIDATTVVSGSPSKATHRVEPSFDARRQKVSPLRESKLSQARKESRPECSNRSASGSHLARCNVEDAKLASRFSLYEAPGIPRIVASPKVGSQNYPRKSGKTLLATFAGRAAPRGEKMIGMHSHPRPTGHLMMILETLDALDRAAYRRRLSRTSTRRKLDVPRYALRSNTLNLPAAPHGTDLNLMPSSAMARRAARPNRSTATHKPELDFVHGRRHGTPGRDKWTGSLRLDDTAGMSSDWTERSENGEVSENAPNTSEDEDKAIRAARSDLINLEPVENVRAMMALDRTEGKQDIQEPSDRSSVIPASELASTGSAPPPDPADWPVGHSQLDKHIAATELPRIARADGHLSSSDSESEGGAWHRVLPRRTGNSNSLRRARQATIDDKTQRMDGEARVNTKTEASERRGSSRPSSAHGTGFRSQNPALSRLFRTGTPEHWGPESSQNQRSGTPDTIRDVRLA